MVMRKGGVVDMDSERTFSGSETCGTEGAEDAIIYSSGMAAIVGVLMSRLNQVMRSFSLISVIIVAESSMPSIFQDLEW